MSEILCKLNSSELVEQFQSFFGIHKISVVDNGSNDWVAVRCDEQDSEPTNTNLKSNYSYGTLSNENTKERNGAIENTGTEEKHGEEVKNIVMYKVTNRVWYLIFIIVSQLGDEGGCAVIFSFWFWNVDGAVIRRVIHVWAITMYLGQALKDILRWPRPTMPQVIQMEKKSELEFGMPSTHTMAGLSVPVSLLYFSLDRYQLNMGLVVAIVSIWSGLVCCSRLYLGMHSVADILAGLALSTLLLIPLLPAVDVADHFIITSPLAPILTVTICTVAIWIYPTTDIWNPSRGLTSSILGIFCGTYLGNWINFQVGFMEASIEQLPFTIMRPSFNQLCGCLMRVLVGGVVGVVTRTAMKPFLISCACFLLHVDKKHLVMKDDHKSTRTTIVDLSVRFLLYVVIGFNCVFFVPLVFSWIGCGRSSFYSEL